MKKYLFFAASAVVALSSCSNEEISEVSVMPGSGKEAIEFSTYISGATRYNYDATEATIKNLEEHHEEYNPDGAGFYVTAKYMAAAKYETLMSGVHFYVDSLDVTKCKVADNQQTQLYYWPDAVDGETAPDVNFYAYYSGRDCKVQPCTLNVDALDEATMNINFHEDDLGKIDVMAASATQSSGDVSLEFSHIMSQVQVNVFYDEDYVEELAGSDVLFILDSLSLVAPSSSVYAFTNNAITASGEYEYSFLEKSTSVTLDNENTLIGTLMIPASSDGSDCKVSVRYSVQINGTSKVYTKSKSELTIKAGYKNVINVTLSANKPISISASVLGWNEAEEQNIDL